MGVDEQAFVFEQEDTGDLEAELSAPAEEDVQYHEEYEGDATYEENYEGEGGDVPVDGYGVGYVCYLALF